MSKQIITLPKPHAGQLQIIQSKASIRVVMCGRQWGKSFVSKILALEKMLDGEKVGFLVPSFSAADKTMQEILEWIPSRIVKNSNKANRKIELLTGGSIQFWSGEAPQRIRGNTYSRFIIDEAAFIPDLENIWQNEVSPTMITTNGDAIFVSTPNGLDFFNSIFLRGKYGEPGYESFHFPSITSPYVSKEYLALKEKQISYDSFRQEYLAEPMATTGNSFGILHIKEHTIEKLSELHTVVYGIDVAKHVDYTVIIGLDKNGHMSYFERYRGEWSLTKEKIKALPNDVLKVMDSTGVGDVLYEELQEVCSNIEGFKFTSSSKPQLMKELIVDVQRGNLKYNDVTAEEMMAFEYFLTATGHPIYRAKQGYHDDCVMSLAMANRYLKQANYSKDWKLYLV